MVDAGADCDHLKECAEVDIYHGTDRCHVAFRGTDSLTDVRSYSNPASAIFNPTTREIQGANGVRNKVIRDMYYRYMKLKDSVVEACEGRPILATGHSLGGAVALIMHAEGSASESITFGAPRIFEGCNLFEGRSLGLYVRDAVTGGVDLVPSVPSALSHCQEDYIQLTRVVRKRSEENFAYHNAVARPLNFPCSGIGTSLRVYRNFCGSDVPYEVDFRFDLHDMFGSYFLTLYDGNYQET